MKREVKIMLALVMIIALGAFSVAAETPWFDLENCDMCKPMMETEGFMENVTWESYPIESGMLSVVTIKEGYEDSYKSCSAKMEENSKKLMSGGEMNLCGMCTAYMGAMDETVKMESVRTNSGEITLMISANAETASKLKAIAVRNTKEMAAMMAAEAGKSGGGGGGHEGHNH